MLQSVDYQMIGSGSAEAVKNSQPRASDITIGLKDKNGVMKFVVTVN
jgi:hypothetical protein